MTEIRAAFRTLARQPAFSLWVIAIFAAGIAANTAVFSIFNGLFLRALPFPQPDRVVYLSEWMPSQNMHGIPISHAEIKAWREGSQAFEDIAAFKDYPDGAYLSGSGDTIRVTAVNVTYNFASLLGFKPILGRDFRPEEDRKNAGNVVLLSYRFWRLHFAGRRDVIGKIIQVDNVAFEIVGVLPGAAVFPGYADMLMPLGVYFYPGDDGPLLSGIARMKPGYNVDQANADLLRLHRNFGASHPLAARFEQEITPLREHYLANYRRLILVSYGAVMFVLLIACVNIAGLLLARGSARSRELAIREALGASRSRLLAQLLIESLMLAIAGGAAGVALGSLALRAALSFMPAILPSWVVIDFDFRTAIFAIALTTAAGVLAGLAPALQSSTIFLREALADTTPAASLSKGRLRAMNLLVVAEFSVAMLLLVAGGLIVKALHRVLTTDPGFRTDSVLTFSLDIPESANRAAQFYDVLLEKLRALPGVDSAGAVELYRLPFPELNIGELRWGTPFLLPGATVPGPHDPPLPLTDLRFITTGYLKAIGVDLIAGRELEQHDQMVKGDVPVLVDETFAREFFPGETNVMGKRIGAPPRDPIWMSIVGIVRPVRSAGMDHNAPPTVYVPHRDVYPQMTIAVHTIGGSEPLLRSIREIVAQIDSRVVPFDIHTMQQRVDRSLWLRRAYSWLFAIFAGFGLLLALAGIYGVISYSVSQRTREIGIRMALGANAQQILASVLRQGFALAAAGVAIGLSIAVYAMRFLDSMLDEVSARDPWTLAITSAILIATALGANAIPARRAAAVNPIEALRCER